MNVPSNFIRGITLKWTESLAEYPASIWDLEFVFINAGGKVEVTATADGDDYDVHVTSAASATFSPGRYDWQAFVSDGSDRYSVGCGSSEVIEDFASATTHDGRSVLRQTVDAINAYLLGNATVEQQKRRWGDREIWTHSRIELITLREKLQRELAAEERRTSPTRKGSVIRSRFK